MTVAAAMFQTQAADSALSLAASAALTFLKVTQHPLSSHLENMNPILSLGLRHTEAEEAQGFVQGPGSRFQEQITKPKEAHVQPRSFTAKEGPKELGVPKELREEPASPLSASPSAPPCFPTIVYLHPPLLRHTSQPIMAPLNHELKRKTFPLQCFCQVFGTKAKLASSQ